MKTIVVLGVGLAGVPAIRQIMRTVVLPSKEYKMIVVSPNTHFHWPLAMPRVVVPGAMDEDKVLLPLDPTFKEYPADKFEFVLGTANNLDPNGNVVSVALNSGSSRSISYDTLIVSTGSSAKEEMPWKLVGTADNTLDRLHSLQRQVENAKTIVIAGGGLTGSETAGEFGYKYAQNGTKEIYFVYSGKLPMYEAALTSVRKQIETDLSRMKIKLIPNTTVVQSTKSGSDIVLELRNKDGTTKKLTTQAYLPTTGIVPNSSFAPSNMLDKDGYIKQTTFLQAEGYKNIFVIGDVGNLEDSKAKKAHSQAEHLIKIFPQYLKGGALSEYQVDDKPMFGISLGPSKGTGQMGTWKIFGFMVWWLKSRYMGTDALPDVYLGKKTLGATFEK